MIELGFRPNTSIIALPKVPIIASRKTFSFNNALRRGLLLCARKSEIIWAHIYADSIFMSLSQISFQFLKQTCGIGLLLMDPRISGSSQSLKMPAHLKFRQKRLQAPEGAKLRSKKVTKHKPLGKFELGKADQVQSRLDSDTPVKELHFSGQKSLEDGNSRRILHSSLGLASWLPMSKDTNFKTRLDFSLPLPVGVQMNGFAHFPGMLRCLGEGDINSLSKGFEGLVLVMILQRGLMPHDSQSMLNQFPVRFSASLMLMKVEQIKAFDFYVRIYQHTQSPLSLSLPLI